MLFQLFNITSYPKEKLLYFYTKQKYNNIYIIYNTNQQCQLKPLVLEEKELNACVQKRVANMHLVNYVNFAENHVTPEKLANKYLFNQFNQFNQFNPFNQKYIVFKRNNIFV